MAHRLTRTLVVCVLLWLPGVAAAQIRATVSDLTSSLQQAGEAIQLRQKDPALAAKLDDAVRVLREAHVLDLDVADVVTRLGHPDAVAIARWRQQTYDFDLTTAETTRIEDALRAIKQLANAELLPLFPGGQLPADFQRAVVALQTAEQQLALADTLENLRRLERKYGPGSAKLNGAEVILAYALQTAPGFGVNAKGRPGALEPVLAYSASYLSRANDATSLLGVGEAGLRVYIFKAGWGESKGAMGLLKPRFLSFGFAATGGSDQSLRAPWQGDMRPGFFVGWGELKAAVLVGANKRVLVTRQFQFIPWAF